MTQEEVLESLEGNRRWLFSTEIAREIGISRGNVNKYLKRLLKEGKVEKQSVIRKGHAVPLWRIKQKK